jgi:flagellar hook-associated protein 2
MADLSSLLGASSSSSSQIEQLVQAYRNTEQNKIDTIDAKISTLQGRQKFYNTLNTKLNTLLSQLDKFTATDASSLFFAKNITSSDTTVLTATSEGKSIIGINQVFVERLASSDILMSNRFNLSDAFGMPSGQQSFDITINGTTKSVAFSLNGTETNEQALTKIVSAINNTDDIGVNAALIKVTSGTAKLTLTSSETGGDNKILFSDSSLMTRLGFVSADLNSSTTSRTVATDTAAGYKNADYNSLDAKLSINGINITRGTNSITDLLTGTTINLLKPQDSGELPITLTTSVNTKGIEDLIKPLLNSYNDLLQFIKSDSNTRRSDTSISSLYSRVRSFSTEKVTGLDSNAPSYITDIGIKIGSDGSLSMGDTDKLKTYLKSDPQKVADLFTSSDGFVAKLNREISNLTGQTGLIKSRNQSINRQIDDSTTRKDYVQGRIDKQADSLRKQYTSLLQVYLDAQNQYSTLLNSSTTG